MKLITTLAFLLLTVVSYSQILEVSKSSVSFFSSAPMEDIKALNTETKGFMDLAKNSFAFSVPITGFEFKKKLMQEHFNENYLESEKYPRAFFQGKIEGLETGSAQQKVEAVGVMSIHGESKEFRIPSNITVTSDGAEVTAKFIVKIADFDIEIPKMVIMNIAEEVEVTVNFTFKVKEK